MKEQSAIWKNNPNLEKIQLLSKGSLSDFLGIVYCAISDESLSAKMPVNAKTKQPFGFLHGGATAAFAESVASMASYLSIDTTKIALGLQLEIHHLQPVSSGSIFGCAKPIRLGRSIQVWQVDIDQDRKRIAHATLTSIIKENRNPAKEVCSP